MQFQVPQFIETEDKIVGPLTLRQFLYFAAAAGTAFLLFFLIELWLWLIFAALFGFIASLFAFIKIEGRPVEKMLFNAFKYYWRPRLYLWQRKRIEDKYQVEEGGEEIEEFAEKRGGAKKMIPSLEFGKIKNLWGQMLTSRKKLKREKRKPEKYVVMRKSTGEKIAMKRIDYR
ncbi:hypothetical protein A3A20_02720 [Candidatus Wolfebacteria bacterium RIFCSPLOWO2_01_FULL_45_19]|uniref:PrgI family protein n=1 Tax=Candidatus Wolfebacteria bacterium RIFCSPLOWO2_01_FULL_45_19 TaxID=1802557 RepID=A0A1F8DS60_9BACT|nr:MAG: hypothetical protein UX23_C0012G0004 [Parcubacteria group bacterium GW2011_GWB1_45_9]OGM91460.1 MAG: hypothetical protein A3A20_02720 [Candidatus Wolfebacteria bacterium RIFCSPLOWO2_01_FULL_45_19]